MSSFVEMGMNLQTGTFGAGCFWGVEETFRTLPGVKETSVGYAGGLTAHPTYREVCSDRTGHAEVVQVTFDPTEISFPQLVDAFFELHDPTQLNRQGPDYGTQYRSVIFYHDAEQERVANQAKTALDASGTYANAVVTQIVPYTEFWPAEEYHQKYLMKRGLGSCHL